MKAFAEGCKLLKKKKKHELSFFLHRSHYVHGQFSMVAAAAAAAEASRWTPLHLCIWDQSLQHHVGNQFSAAPGQDESLWQVSMH